MFLRFSNLKQYIVVVFILSVLGLFYSGSKVEQRTSSDRSENITNFPTEETEETEGDDDTSDESLEAEEEPLEVIEDGEDVDPSLDALHQMISDFPNVPFDFVRLPYYMRPKGSHPVSCQAMSIYTYFCCTHSMYE